MNKRVLAMLLCLVMVLSVMSIGATAYAEDAVPAHKETLVIGTAADINNLNLQKQQDATNNIILKNTHQTLLFFNNDPNAATRFDPGLATDWEFTDDTHIIMHLRDDVYFNDGEKTPMTAEDVKYTLDMAVGEGSKVAGNLAGFVSCSVVDEHTVEIEIETYNNEFIYSLASVPLSIQSKKAWESGMDEPWFEFRPYLEASSRVIALQNGEIDVCIDPPMNELQYLEEDKNVTVYEQTGTRLFYFAFNTQKAPWDNEKLRQAVACAINRDDVLTVAVDGKGTLQKTILNRGLWGFYDDMEGFNYDLDRAKALMAEAGYPDGGISTTLTYSTSGAYANIATVIQDNLSKIGITVTLNPMEDATLKETCVNGDQELYLWRWNEDSKVDFVYRDLYYTGSTSNYHHYSDPHADELIDKVATEKDQDARMAAGIELQEYLVNACPQVPLYIANLVIAFNKDLQGQYFYGGGNHNWSHAYIAK